MRSSIKELNTVEELDRAIAESDKRPVLLFKHSLTCPISARAYRELESYLEQAGPGVEHKLIIVQNARTVSNEAAARLGVRHESPQALLVRNGREIWNASHLNITASSLAEAVKNQN